MHILQTPTFAKKAKKLHENQKLALDQAVSEILSDPEIGDAKKGDLGNIRVYKFTMLHQLILLAYEFDDDEQMVTLLSFGPHENFYRDLKSK